ncbi:hypothetical protein EVG20_g9871 [Dentipellis fragilis]|uniref:EF-hand domain-containing protein n=1 Tax=Dentipellis fragilis TaxID=205917 RepID=A0A4Y9XXB7_9AGAM|nr:hypothetical protein EVG20_g9871 [Dentipellis fragilis]
MSLPFQIRHGVGKGSCWDLDEVHFRLDRTAAGQEAQSAPWLYQCPYYERPATPEGRQQAAGCGRADVMESHSSTVEPSDLDLELQASRLEGGPVTCRTPLRAVPPWALGGRRKTSTAAPASAAASPGLQRGRARCAPRLAGVQAARTQPRSGAGVADARTPRRPATPRSDAKVWKGIDGGTDVRRLERRRETRNRCYSSPEIPICKAKKTEVVGEYLIQASMLSPRLSGYNTVQMSSPEEKGADTATIKSEFTTDDTGYDRAESLSYHSHAPFNVPPPDTYPPTVPQPSGSGGRRVQFPFGTNNGSGSAPRRPTSQHAQSSSWDLLAGVRKFEQSMDQFDSRNASEQHLVFAEGDLPKSRVVRFYNYLLNVSIVTRWTLFIVPVLVLLWIPGILGFTVYPKAAIWGTRLTFWSIWFSVVWVGWWAALASAMVLPAVPIASSPSPAERIADQKAAVRTLVTLYRHSKDIPGRSENNGDNLANKRASLNPRRFFKRALKQVRFAATTTTTALGNVASEIAGSSVLQPNSPQAMVQTALESVNKTRFVCVFFELAGPCPSGTDHTCFSQLAHRLFYSFHKPYAEYLTVDDFTQFFTTLDEADAAFSIFDKDANGDISREEMEMACLDIHREQLSIEHSMRDLDSAVGRLDNILMSVYVVIAILILAVALIDRHASTPHRTGLSWLIGGSLAEVLTSIIFLFIKHPYDVGDKVTLEEKGSFTVKEIRLLSSIFLDGNGTLVQAPNTANDHAVAHPQFIQNIRRSPQMSEPFTFDASYATSFEDIEKLREHMQEFVRTHRRDYQPIFDIVVVDIPDQEKMTLKADIMYKSNWQQGGLKAKRRNKWVCALKTALAEVKIFGPEGNPDAVPAPTRYTLVPWEQVEEEERRAAFNKAPAPPMPEAMTMPTFTNSNAVLLAGSEDIFGEAHELQYASPQSTLNINMSAPNDTNTNTNTNTNTVRRRSPQMPSAPVPVTSMPLSRSPGEEIEMAQRV